MVLILKNPYNDDEILTAQGDSSKIVEQYIHDNMNIVGINEDTEIAWGEYGKEILSSGYLISLRCQVYLQDSEPIAYGGGRWSFTDNMNIDVYVVNEDDDRKNRSPKALKIFHWLRQFFITNQNNEHKGIFEIKWRYGFVENDVVRPDTTKVVATVQVTYVGDIVNV